jgi:uncharacterized membrane protein YfcA
VTGAELILLAVSGLFAGAINAAVGSGTLITYPALLSIGFSPVIANATNSLGMVPGAISGAWSYRAELANRRNELLRWSAATAAGAVVGAILVVILPAKVFAFVVPWLILSACLVIALQPLIVKSLARRQTSPRATAAAIGGVGLYGGYFGAGQGIASLAVLMSLAGDTIHRANAAKNVLAAVTNGTAATVFILAGRVVWLPALVIGAATLVGGFAGGGIARRLPAAWLRGLVILIGLYAVYISIRGW